jgi:hypothetical protein
MCMQQQHQPRKNLGANYSVRVDRWPRSHFHVGPINQVALSNLVVCVPRRGVFRVGMHARASSGEVDQNHGNAPPMTINCSKCPRGDAAGGWWRRKMVHDLRNFHLATILIDRRTGVCSFFSPLWRHNRTGRRDCFRESGVCSPCSPPPQPICQILFVPGAAGIFICCLFAFPPHSHEFSH